MNSRVVVSELFRLLAFVVAFSLVGLMFDGGVAFPLAGMLAYTTTHVIKAWRLRLWFVHKRLRDIPDAGGLWGDIFLQVYRQRKRFRKRKRQLAKILSRFRQTTSAMPDAAVVLGERFDIQWFNGAAVSLLGLKAPQDSGKQITFIVRDPNFGAYLRDGQFGEPLQIPSPVDRNRHLSITVVPYGGRHQFLVQARDVTNLVKTDQIRRDFIANASHELRTPLTVIRGYLEAMQMERDEHANDDTLAPVVPMLEQVGRMQSIIDDLLLLSRLESSRPEPVAGDNEVHLAELVSAAVAEAEKLSGGRHQFAIDVADDIRLRASAKELRSVIGNLLDNAVKYTDNGGHIAVAWEDDESGGVVSVSDDGIGIEPVHIPRLTERFYRVDVAQSRASGGTGLGLAIVKHVLHRHDARLQIDSTPRHGSTFRCHFPASRIAGRQAPSLQLVK